LVTQLLASIVSEAYMLSTLSFSVISFADLERETMARAPPPVTTAPGVYFMFVKRFAISTENASSVCGAVPKGEVTVGKFVHGANVGASVGGIVGVAGGMSTRLMRCTTPFDAKTSAVVTVAFWTVTVPLSTTM
jgi:hypothetical protein